jgi:hypothetical protein
MTVKRYSAHTNIDDFKADWHEKKDGPMVRYEDYAALLKERDALAVENASLKECCDAYDADGLAQYGDQWEVTPLETPATDAAIANIQAQGVDKFAANEREWAAHWEKHGVTDGSISRCLMVAQDADKFAAQLRKEPNHD